uniref:Envelope protein n=2 Tax=Gopherus evgoodei TaxID=1825980 RepID=A0A8C4WMQ2_9SAUR
MEFRSELATVLLLAMGALILVTPGSPQAHAGWRGIPNKLETNTYEALKACFAQEFNLSNCWICSQIPHHAVGLPWRVVPQNWSDLCWGWFSRGKNISGTPLSQNCTIESQYALRDDPWEPQANSTHLPPPIRLRPVNPGLVCYQQSKSSNHTWSAGNSTCQYYLSPGSNASIPVYVNGKPNSTAWFGTFSSSQTERWQSGYNGLVGNGHSFYVCGTSAYKWLPHRWYGSCYVGYLAPPLRVFPKLPPGRPRHRRSLYVTPEPIGVGDRLGMILLPSYGVGRLSQMYRKLSMFLTKFANETLAIEKSLNSELYQLRLLALQNRQALDYVLASQGGVCALVGSECCTYVPENSQDINKHILSAEQALSHWKAQEREPT